MRCTNCGIELSAGVRFCPDCGTPAPAAEAAPAAAAAVTPPEPQPAPPAEPVAQIASTPPPPPPPAPEPPLAAVPPPVAPQAAAPPPVAPVAPPSATAPPPPPPPAPAPAGAGGLPPAILGLAAVAAVAVLALLYLFVIKGDTSEGAGLDPKKADELAAVAVISARDLPGSGWKLTDFDNDDSGAFAEDFPDTDSCDKVGARIQFLDDVRAKRVGRAQRSFERQGNTRDEPLSVEIEVSVYPDSKTVSSAFGNFKSALQSSDFEKCVQDLFSQDLDAGESATSKPVKAYASAPSNGVSTAFEVELKSRTEQATYRLEFYYWQFGNAVAQVAIFGPKDAYAKDVPEAAIAKLTSGLTAAASSSPPTAVAAVIATNTAVRSPVVQATSRTSTPSAAGTARPSGTTTTGATRYGKLSDLNSFRSVLKIEGFGGPLSALQDLIGTAPATGTPSATQNVSFEVEGAYVKPDKGQQTMKLGALTVVQTTIARQQWNTFAGISSGPTSGTYGLEDYSLAASIWDESFLNDPPPFACTTRENVNSVATRKCGIDQQTFNAVSGIIGPFLDSSDISELTRFSFEIWLAETGDYPVRIRLEMVGKDAARRDFNVRLSLDVTNVNSSITINPPR